MRKIDINDIVGQRFGKLVVKSYIGKQLCGKSTMTHMYDCACDCGRIHVNATRSALLSGDKISCGCSYKDAGLRVKENLIGQRFGRWLVVNEAPNRVSLTGKTRSIMWKCRCDCGTVKDVRARALKTGTSTSCGCLQREHVSKALTDDLTGRRFSYLTVLYRNGSHAHSKKRNGSKSAVWHCRCDCGNELDVMGMSLKNGDCTSCGCKKRSRLELDTQKYLESIGFVLKRDFWIEKSFKDLQSVVGGKLRFDFYIKTKDFSCFIECQGEQHYKPIEWFGGQEYYNRLTKNSEIKRQYASERGIDMIEVPYTLCTFEDVSDFLSNYFVDKTKKLS